MIADNVIRYGYYIKTLIPGFLDPLACPNFSLLQIIIPSKLTASYAIVCGDFCHFIQVAVDIYFDFQYSVGQVVILYSLAFQNEV